MRGTELRFRQQTNQFSNSMLTPVCRFLYKGLLGHMSAVRHSGRLFMNFKKCKEGTMNKQKPCNLFVLVTALALLMPMLAGAYPAEVPRTGQTGCYDADYNATSCTGTGQDGEIQAGAVWPEPRFTDREDGTISDNLTGLVWAQNANLLGTVDADNNTDFTDYPGTVTWQHALNYIKRLNRLNYLGYSDWRLPNKREIRSLVDYAHLGPALPSAHPFLNVQLYYGYYWSSTSGANDTSSAWFMGVSTYGWVVYKNKSSGGLVWPVRSGQCGALDNSVMCLPKTGQTTCYKDNGSEIDCEGTGQDGELQKGVDWPDPRFIDHGDNTTTDNLTGLMWAKNANLLGTVDADNDTEFPDYPGVVTWQHALDYIKRLNRLNYLGYNDWRLPNVNELESLVHAGAYSPALPIGCPFSNVLSYGYWSSTTSYASGPGVAWIVHMGFGHVSYDAKTGYFYVWPVRSGQVDNPPISTTTTTAGTTTTTTAATESTTTTSIISTTTTTTGSTTTTTISTRPCPIARSLGEDNPTVELLRTFRDSRLAQSAVGRRIIQIYYNNADSMNAALDRSPALQRFTRSVLKRIAPLAGRKEE